MKFFIFTFFDSIFLQAQAEFDFTEIDKQANDSQESVGEPPILHTGLSDVSVFFEHFSCKYLLHFFDRSSSVSCEMIHRRLRLSCPRK